MVARSAASFFSVLITMLVVRGVATTNRTMKFATNLMLAGTVIFVSVLRALEPAIPPATLRNLIARAEDRS